MSEEKKKPKTPAEGETPNERFERLAAEYQRETGRIAFGKDWEVWMKALPAEGETPTDAEFQETDTPRSLAEDFVYPSLFTDAGVDIPVRVEALRAGLARRIDALVKRAVDETASKWRKMMDRKISRRLTADQVREKVLEAANDAFVAGRSFVSWEQTKADILKDLTDGS